MSDEPRRVVGRLIKHVLSSIVRSIDDRMQPHGLTGMQWEPLVLIHFENIDTVAALARSSQVNCGAMTRMLDRLETKQFLLRQRSSTDRRVVHLELTPKGKKVAQAILPLALDAVDRHLKGFAPSEVATLNELLGRMLVNGARPVADDSRARY